MTEHIYSTQWGEITLSNCMMIEPYTELVEFNLHLEKKNIYIYIYNVFLISKFDRVLIVVLVLLDDSPVSEFYMLMF
jgi:hypothetical protein